MRKVYRVNLSEDSFEDLIEEVTKRRDRCMYRRNTWQQWDQILTELVTARLTAVPALDEPTARAGTAR